MNPPRIIEMVPVGLRNERPQWPLLGNHSNITSLQALASLSKSHGEGAVPFVGLF